MSYLKPVEVLERAKSVIEDEANWQKGDYYNAEGTCFCSVGAVFKALKGNVKGINPKELPMMDGEELAAYRRATEHLSHSTFPAHIIDFNDDPTTTHADVLAVFDKAIEEAKNYDTP